MPGQLDDPHRFDFDLDRGIREQLLKDLKRVHHFRLTKNVGPPISGIYALYHKNTLVYVDKASKETTISGTHAQSPVRDFHPASCNIESGSSGPDWGLGHPAQFCRSRFLCFVHSARSCKHAHHFVGKRQSPCSRLSFSTRCNMRQMANAAVPVASDQGQ